MSNAIGDNETGQELEYTVLCEYTRTYKSLVKVKAMNLEDAERMAMEAFTHPVIGGSSSYSATAMEARTLSGEARRWADTGEGHGYTPPEKRKK